MVQKVIHRDTETKDACVVFPLTAFNSLVNSTGDVLRVLPTVQPGTANGQRIGDNILGKN